MHLTKVADHRLELFFRVVLEDIVVRGNRVQSLEKILGRQVSFLDVQDLVHLAIGHDDLGQDLFEHKAPILFQLTVLLVEHLVLEV